ncbi:MAG: AMP-binding protein [Coxiellaceae bacterium]|nr:MAG: AMP-binding protein [Coxiellaceae bacterium]
MQNFQQKTGVPIRLGYGMSELLLIAINKSLREDKMTSVGKPAKNVQIKLLDAEGKPVALGAMGEVWVQGNNCMIGYWHDAAETAKAIVNGWLRTGDLARCDADGYYWIVGRIKQMIIRGGDNIAPLEVEEVLASHPAVKVAAVIAVPDPIEGEVPKAFVELKAGRTVHENQLLAFLHERLEDYKVPVTIIVLDALPRTPTGKIAREELKKY